MVSFFQKMCRKQPTKFKKLISFVFSIPLSNAFCEKAFSILNDLYSNDRNRMSFDLIKAGLLIRIHFDEEYKCFKNFLKAPDGTELVNSVTKNIKYMWQKT